MPDSDDEIVEEVNYLHSKKRGGTKITKKQTPLTHPLQVKAGEASRSRSKGKRKVQVHRVEETTQEDVANIADMDTYEVIEGYDGNTPEPVVEVIQPQVMVRSHIFFCHSTDHE